MKEMISIKANAKINSFLDILFKREDGYHEIKTVFHEIDLYDVLNFALTKKQDIKILTNIRNLENKDNLIYKVAVFIKKRYNVESGAEIELTKNIPIAAGLAGGSTDAATTIVGLSKIWGLNLTIEEMDDVASRFGSDINFFLYGGRAIGESRGEIITPLSDINLENIFLVNPGFHVASGEAYKAALVSPDSNRWNEYTKSADIELAYNALELKICEKYPKIRNIIEHIKSLGVKAMLSGSGPTVIGFCQDREQAEYLSAHYSKIGYWNIITKTIKRERKCFHA